jgi:hypothetical protein
MLDTIVHSGFAVADRRLVDLAVGLRDDFVDIAQ